MSKTERTSEGLCEALFEEFDLLRQGKTDPHRASAIAKLAVQIINTKRLEIEAGSLSKGGYKFPPLTLSSKGLAIGSSK